MVDAASREDLEDLVRRVGPHRDELGAWLAGPEASRPRLTNEYVAMSELLRATESAELRLRPSARVDRLDRLRQIVGKRTKL